MKPILISWFTEGEDIKNGNLSIEGPNAIFHQYFWQHDQHVLLYAQAEQGEQVRQFVNLLNRHYPGRKITPKLLIIQQQHDLAEVKSRLEALLLNLRKDPLDLLLLSGSYLQQLAWFLSHQSLGSNSRLLAWQWKQDSPQLHAIAAEEDLLPRSVVIRQQALDQPREEPQLITPRMIPLYRQAQRAGQSDRVRVLISGANGTGKTHLARYLHQQSPRSSAPFITLNCGGSSVKQLHRRLFGHDDQPGALSLAEGGTLIFNDIHELDRDLQYQLIQLMQEGIDPLSAPHLHCAPNVRIISTTICDLAELCASGEFLWELYYLISVVELEIPDLYHRGVEEIGRLIDYFLYEKKVFFDRQEPLRLDPDARRRLETYTWPGNVRELEHLIERLYVFCDDTVTVEDLPRRFHAVETGLSENWRDVEAQHLRRVYERYGRNKSRTCRVIGYGSINTLKKKLREYGIEGESEPEAVAE